MENNINNALTGLEVMADLMKDLGDLKKAATLGGAAATLREHINDLSRIAEYYRKEAEKNLNLQLTHGVVVWHSVKEILPSRDGTYLVVGKTGGVHTAHFYPNRTICGHDYAWHFSNRYVTHWAELPPAPIKNNIKRGTKQ